MNKLLIATKNPGKLVELTNFLSDLDVEIISLKNLNITDDVLEDGETYGDNSRKKAIFYSEKSGLPTISDDGGIEIDGLAGKPGVHSRRYFSKAGEIQTDEEIISAMADLLRNLAEDKKGATFRTVVTLAMPNGEVYSTTDFVTGVLKEPKLKLLKGYPYRSFFFLPELNKYYHESELTQEEMKKYNHRYKAIQKLKPIIKKVLSIKYD